MELKKHDQDIQNAYTDNYRDYLDTIPHLFHHNVLIMLSNGLESRVGTVGAKWEDKNLVLRDIQELLQERLAHLLNENPSRINFYERYQEIIQAYNQEQNRATIEKTFEELMHLSQKLSEEEKRYVREGFKSDEELTLYDLLLKDGLSRPEIKKLKGVAIELLAKIKGQLAGMDHPFDKPATRAALVITIRDMLWLELPES